MSEDNNFEINVEQILASILKQHGTIEVDINNLMADYSEYTVAVNINEDQTKLTFEIVSVNDVESE